jgi:hypothetical protein
MIIIYYFVYYYFFILEKKKVNLDAIVEKETSRKNGQKNIATQFNPICKNFSVQTEFLIPPVILFFFFYL